ncbi:hypothetical protein COR50_01410 [Chitinophaga caeni]|uniref:FAS1 domain-containing protein n=1 Tax=Chitinophaga caeni TaxID=2029983 RepID=A0A291QPS6_9BACT|nr:hypothetical protein [Chitinophaga caeni]ATL45925.1 hypothetical protein COR50_01410 [Chitinophaga caeni]
MKKRNALTGIAILSFALVGLFFSACQKDGGYYEFEKNPNVINSNIYEHLKSKVGVYDSMVYLIDRLGLERIFRSNKLTVFAIPNASFETALYNLNVLRQSEGKEKLYLADLDRENLDTLFCRYVIPGSFTTDSVASFVDGRNFNSLKYNQEMNMQLYVQPASGFEDGGPKYIIYSDTKQSFYIVRWVRTNTSAMDTYLSNGVLHTLASDHEFGFDEFITRFNR